MTRHVALQWLARVVGPVLLLVLGGALAQLRATTQRGRFHAVPAALPAAQRKALESVPALAVANATWAFGSLDSVKQMLRFELDRLPASDGPSRARVLVRFGIIDTNPEGQAAIFSQACAADASLCDHEKEAAEREVHARFVPPGNRLPLYFVPNHPPIFGF